MDEQVRSELTDLLRTGGRNLCTMPRMLGVLLRQRCPEADGPVGEIEQALTSCCIRPIVDAVGPVDEHELAERLAADSGMAPDRAKWVIETWVHAIAAADNPPPLAADWSTWNRLDVSRETAGGRGGYQRAVGHLIVVGLAGAMGGMSLGLYRMTLGDAELIGPWRDALEDFAPWLQVVALLSLGILGGFAGGLLGWIFAGGRSWTYDALGGTSLGRLVLAALGALQGAGIGVMAGLAMLGLIGVMLGALIGSLVGAVLGLLVAEGISRFWW